MTENTNSIRDSRIAKLENLREAGINPYPGIFKPEKKISSILEEYEKLKQPEEGEKTFTTITAGRIMLLRHMGKAAFANIRDDSGNMQIYVRKDITGEENFAVFRNSDIGDIIGVQGEVFRTRTGEVTIKATKITMLSKTLSPLPEKFHGLTDKETRYRQRYLDLIMNTDVKEVFRRRSQAVRALREFLYEQEFLEVETPMMQPLYGGAAARPFVTHHNTLDMDLYLRIAPELYLKRLIVGGFERVFELNRNFRNEGISFKHNPEFTMMELYQAYADYNDMMDLFIRIVLKVNEAVNPGTTVITYGEHTIDLAEEKWKKIRLLDALKDATGLDFQSISDQEAFQAAEKAEISVKPGTSKWKILDEFFKEKVEPHLIQPTIIYDYPLEISPLAKQKSDNPEIVERFEPYIAGQEIGNAFSELNDPQEQKKRFLSQLEEKSKGDSEAHEMDEDYVTALEYAMPPTGGLGIGVDRLIMILLGQTSIRDIILFPQLRRN